VTEKMRAFYAAVGVADGEYREDSRAACRAHSDALDEAARIVERATLIRARAIAVAILKRTRSLDAARQERDGA
jgi:hypothetical protein